MMDSPYPTTDASSWKRSRDEPLGRKPKMWLIANDDQRWLFKYRHQPGDDWAERAAAEIASLLGIPHATTELGELDEKLGVLSLDFTDRGRKGELVFGNDLLLEGDPNYPAGERFHVAAHTVQKVLDVLARGPLGSPLDFVAEAAVGTAPEVFLAYLMLDALIGNTDRHHENWGVLRPSTRAGAIVCLAPSFDHAASLGQILTDTERTGRLETRDRNYTVAAYVRRARSALYEAPGDSRPLSPLDAFQAAGRRYPQTARHWLAKLGALSEDELLATVERVPSDRISDPGRRFAKAMLVCNRTDLLKVRLP